MYLFLTMVFLKKKKKILQNRKKFENKNYLKKPIEKIVNVVKKLKLLKKWLFWKMVNVTN